MSLLLLILFWFTCISYTFQQQQQQIVLNIPIELHGTTGDTKFLDFYLHEGEDVHHTVSNFCLNNTIDDAFCQLLMKSVLDKLSGISSDTIGSITDPISLKKGDGSTNALSPLFECLAVDNMCIEFDKQKAEFAKIGHRHGTDKITHHGYHRYYPRFLDYYRSMIGVSMIEIGIDQKKSLLTWLEYFPNAFIYGIDIRVASSGPRHKIFRADQSNAVELESIIKNEISHPVFFIVDDGSHIPEHQIASFNYLFSNTLMPGGVYIIEDIETSYWITNGIYGYPTNYGFRHSKSIIEIFKDLVDEINNEFLNQQAKNLQDDRLGSDLSVRARSSISSITFGQNCIIIVKKTQEEEIYANRDYRFSTNL